MRHRFISIMLVQANFLSMDWEKIGNILGCSSDEAIPIFNNYMEELRADTFTSHVKSAMALRLSTDFRSAGIITGRLDDTLSIVSFGQAHINLSQPNFIRSLLSEKSGSAVGVMRF